MTLRQAWQELFDEMSHSWRCAFEDDPGRPGHQRAIEKPRLDTCTCWARETIETFERAVRANERLLDEPIGAAGGEEDAG